MPLAAEFAAVSKSYRSLWPLGQTVHALRDVSFAVERGEAFALLGPNRAGKTTLLKILLGLCRPSQGRVTRLGCPLSDRDTLARVGYMHESQAFPSYLTPVTLLGLYGGMTGIPPSTLKARIPALLETVRLADRALEPIARFSKGMVQRLALAQAVLAEPELLVLDEPMEGLDLDARRLLHEIVDQQRRAGKSVLIVSHGLSEVAQVCDRLAVLVEGRLVHLGPVAPLLRDETGGTRSLDAALAPLYHSGGSAS